MYSDRNDADLTVNWEKHYASDAVYIGAVFVMTVQLSRLLPLQVSVTTSY